MDELENNKLIINPNPYGPDYDIALRFIFADTYDSSIFIEIKDYFNKLSNTLLNLQVLDDRNLKNKVYEIVYAFIDIYIKKNLINELFDDQTILYVAVVNEDSRLVKYLLERGADPYIRIKNCNNYNPYSCAFRHDMHHIIAIFDKFDTRNIKDPGFD
jgi:hypothetical protein